MDSKDDLMFSFRVQESKERGGDIKPPVRIWRVIKDRQEGFLEVNCQKKSTSCTSNPLHQC